MQNNCFSVRVLQYCFRLGESCAQCAKFESSVISLKLISSLKQSFILVLLKSLKTDWLM